MKKFTLAVLMLFALVLMPTDASAGVPEIAINGAPLNGLNSDITGNGYSWVALTKTLSLISPPTGGGSFGNIVISCDSTGDVVTVDVAADVTVGAIQSVNLGSLVIDGDETLTLTPDGTTLPLLSMGRLTIQGNVIVAATGAIGSIGNLSITGSSVVTVQSGFIFSVNGNVSVNTDKTVTVSVPTGYNVATITNLGSNGTHTINPITAINASGSISIDTSESTLAITTTRDAPYAFNVAPTAPGGATLNANNIRVNGRNYNAANDVSANNNNNNNNTGSGSDSGGTCNSGFGAGGLLLVLALGALRKK